jgi:hypothetical protein
MKNKQKKMLILLGKVRVIVVPHFHISSNTATLKTSGYCLKNFCFIGEALQKSNLFIRNLVEIADFLKGIRAGASTLLNQFQCLLINHFLFNLVFNKLTAA